MPFKLVMGTAGGDWSMKVAALRLGPGADLRLSLPGTLSPDGAHRHIAIFARDGSVMGGPLCPGSLVGTTAELVIGLLPEWQFRQVLDPATRSAELQIRRPDPG